MNLDETHGLLTGHEASSGAKCGSGKTERHDQLVYWKARIKKKSGERSGDNEEKEKEGRKRAERLFYLLIIGAPAPLRLFETSLAEI